MNWGTLWLVGGLGDGGSHSNLMIQVRNLLKSSFLKNQNKQKEAGVRPFLNKNLQIIFRLRTC